MVAGGPRDGRLLMFAVGGRDTGSELREGLAHYQFFISQNARGIPI